MKKTAGIIFRTIILLLLGITIGLFISDNNFTGRSLGFTIIDNDKVSKALDLIKHSYVDSVNTDSLEGVSINNLLQSLDPHSLYLPAQQAQSLNEKLEGGFNGIGLEYILLRDTLVITQAYPEGPAGSVGLMAGDKVITVDGKKFSGTH